MVTLTAYIEDFFFIEAKNENSPKQFPNFNNFKNKLIILLYKFR